MALDPQKLERCFFPFVGKPDRYVGHESGLPSLDPDPILRVALAFPDLYELGMSYLGLRILLHIANSVDGIACERVFMPWFDAVERLRSQNLPLFTLETKTPLNELDLIGINLQYELHTTNILALLDLGRIPIRASNREERDPIIIGGGPLALSPEPYAPFFDALAMGDGENIFPEILKVLKEGKNNRISRHKQIRALGEIPGIYLPGYYRPAYDKSGSYKGIERQDSGLPLTIKPRITSALLPQFYPEEPIVPVLEATHNRFILEISRGCTRGCRFCGPGMVNRPARERPVADLIEAARQGLEETGYSELSLLSLSTADYRYLDELLIGLEPVLNERRAALSFPSLRPDMFTEKMADHASSHSRTGLTFAPEAATLRLRAVINKDTSDEALLNAVKLAFERGWKVVKLYFMVGLPTETDEDVEAVVNLVMRVCQIGNRYKGRRVNVSISPFSPKPHTPFEREAQASPEELRRRFTILKHGFRKQRMVHLDLRSPEISQVESVIVRGDRRCADVIEESYKAGGLFEAWTDGFSWKRWRDALVRNNMDPAELTGALVEDRPLPWDHIDVGILPEFIKSEKQEMERGNFTPDCRQAGCQFCGLHEVADTPCPDIPELPVVIPPKKISSEDVLEKFHSYRLVYTRGKELKFSGHLSVIGTLERALRKLNVPLEYTKGFKPHLKLSTSPPLGFGMTSDCELMDFGIAEVWSSEINELMQKSLPAGISSFKVVDRSQNQTNVGALNVFLYACKPLSEKLPPSIIDRVEELNAVESLPILRIGTKRTQTFDAKPKIWKLALEKDVIHLGVQSLTGPTPKVVEIIKLIIESGNEDKVISPEDIIAAWDIRRIGIWWESDDVFNSPVPQLEEKSQN